MYTHKAVTNDTKLEEGRI